MTGSAINDLETFTVSDVTVSCDGGAKEFGGALGHPRVYLTINLQTGDVVCPYCSRRYVLAEGAKVAAH